MTGPLIVTGVLFCAVLVHVYWPRLGDLIDRWRDWRHDREFQKRHRQGRDW